MRLLEVADLASGYGKGEVLHGVNLHLDDGEVVVIIGPNGAGKSTLLKTIFGVLKPIRGRITFMDQSLVGLSVEEIFNRGLSIVPQEDNVFPSLTVLENLEMGAFTLDRDIAPKLEEVYSLFPVLKERSRQRAGTLSGGERQMLAIGRALMIDPKMLCVDEPSSGLAPFLVKEVFQRLKEISTQGTTTFIVEQNEQALRLAHRCYLLDQGEIRYEDTAEAFMQRAEIKEIYLGGRQ